MSMDHYNKLERDGNFICRAAAADEKNLSSSYRNPELNISYCVIQMTYRRITLKP